VSICDSINKQGVAISIVIIENSQEENPKNSSLAIGIRASLKSEIKNCIRLK
jgi:hypothetical protein